MPPDGPRPRVGPAQRDFTFPPADSDMDPVPVKPPITMDDLDKLDIRAGTILSVTEVEGSDKLMKLTVDFGSFQRSILSGIKKEREDCSEIEGLQALFVVNMPPRKMAGQVSEGMLFDVGYADGVLPALAVTERTLPNGARAG
jgi:methionine--tRNA ligase beta chain